MTREEWQRVKPILESALELEPSSRPRFLEGACADVAQRREVESLIAAHEQARTDVLNCAVFPGILPKDEARFRLLPGKRIGAFEILEEIAVGGMGAVYRAVRADGQYKQEVALKIVRAELGGELTAARFRNERQILASLDHSNIAKILDGGATADGLPYFVMELIDGQPITKYCDQRKLTIDARLNLFRTVCSAVHHAHQHLVIHRDIKPTNILITSAGVPKLLDFGIAKILDPSLLPENVTVTAAGLGMMTPEYASPEQLRGQAITTATDSYSLGLVLYELLAGHSAYRFASHLPHEVARVVLESDPEKPSTAIRRREEAGAENQEKVALTPELVSSLRGDSPDKLHRRVAGDLDNIVLKAIRKEPAARYTSVDQLSEDIRRHLEGLPVLARKSTLAYRCRKYFLRHKAGVAAAALVLLSLLTGMVSTLRQARIARDNQLRAERRFNDVRKLANTMLFDIHDAIQLLPGSTSARKLIVQQGLEYLDSLSGESADNPDLQKDLAAGYQKLGDVQGYRAIGNVGDNAGAIASYRKSAQLREGLVRRSPHDLILQNDLAKSYRLIASLLSSAGKQDEADEYLEKALRIAGRLAEENPRNTEILYNLGAIEWERGRSQTQRANFEASLAAYRESAATFQRVGTLDPSNLRARRAFAIASKNIGGLLEELNRLDEAVDSYRIASDIDQQLLAREPENAMYLRDSSVDYRNLGDVSAKQNKLEEARREYERGMGVDQRLVELDRTDRNTEHYLVMDHKSLGNVLLKMGEGSAALASLRAALSLQQEICKHDTNDADMKSEMAKSYVLLGDANAGLAKSAKQSERAGYMAAACSSYSSARQVWNAMQTAGVLNQLNHAELTALVAKMGNCRPAAAAH